MAEKIKKEINRLKISPFAFLICLLLAIGGWFIITFSKNYSQTLDYKVICTQYPENVKQVSTSDTIIFITLNARGFNYFKRSFSDDNRVVFISVENIVNSKGRRNVYSFTKKELASIIQENNILGGDFVEIEKPEILTFYLK